MAKQFKTTPQDRFLGQATSLSSHIGIANKIVKEKLTTTQLAIFRKTVFRRFIDMDIIINNPLVHHILLRELEDDRGDAMTFDLNGTIVMVSKEEFLLVIGLWRLPNPVVVNRAQRDAAGSLQSHYFINDFSRDIHIGTLELVYKEMKFENDMDAVKMSLVYYTELAMMGKEKMRANVWAYEIISTIARKVATRLKCCRASIPQVGGTYSLPTRIMQHDVFEPSETTITPTLVMSEREMQYRDTRWRNVKGIESYIEIEIET